MRYDETWKERLQRFVKMLDVSQTTIAQELETSLSNVNNWIHRNEKISPQLISYLVREHDLNANWLVTGEGNARRGLESKVAEGEPDYVAGGRDKLILTRGDQVYVGDVRWRKLSPDHPEIGEHDS